jgi:phage protein D
MTFPSSGIAVYAPTFTVKLEGEEIPTEDITGIEIDEQIQNSGMCVISFNDMLDMKKQKFRWLDDNRIQPGNLIEISFSYASSSKKSTLVFLGRIKSVTHDFDFSGKTALSVTGFDLSHDLQESWSGNCVYNDKTYSEIVSSITSSNNLDSGTVDDSEQVYENVSRLFDEDDYKFIKRLANRIGFEFFVREKSYYFRKPEDEKDAKIIFTNGINITTFTPKVNSSTIVHEVKIISWDRYKKEAISQTASLKDIENSVYIPQVLKGQQPVKKIRKFLNVLSAKEAKTRSIAELKRKNKNLFTGRLEIIGNPSLRPGITVKIEKVGNRFSGVYYIEEAKHIIRKEGYQTTLELRRCK